MQGFIGFIGDGGAGGAGAVPKVIRATIAADSDDYAPTGFDATCTALILTTTAGRNLDGLKSTGFVDGQVILLINAGASSGIVTARSDRSSSLAANRLQANNLGSVILNPGGGIPLMYDAVAQRWRALNQGS